MKAKRASGIGRKRWKNEKNANDNFFIIIIIINDQISTIGLDWVEW